MDEHFYWYSQVATIIFPRARDCFANICSSLDVVAARVSRDKISCFQETKWDWMSTWGSCDKFCIFFFSLGNVGCIFRDSWNSRNWLVLVALVDWMRWFYSVARACDDDKICRMGWIAFGIRDASHDRWFYSLHRLHHMVSTVRAVHAQRTRNIFEWIGCLRVLFCALLFNWIECHNAMSSSERKRPILSVLMPINRMQTLDSFSGWNDAHHTLNCLFNARVAFRFQSNFK